MKISDIKPGRIYERRMRAVGGDAKVVRREVLRLEPASCILPTAYRTLVYAQHGQPPTVMPIDDFARWAHRQVKAAV